jgi:site-specific recombinase XerD
MLIGADSEQIFKRLGVDLKTIQEILRHAHLATTADIYVKEVSEQAVEAMQRLEKHVEAVRLFRNKLLI